MTRRAELFLRFSPLGSGRSVSLWCALSLLAFPHGSAVAQDLVVPTVNVSGPPLAASSPPTARPAVIPVTARPVSAGASASTGSTLAQGKPVVSDTFRWRSLSAPQRRALAPLEQDWDSIDMQRRRKWLEIASRFSSLSSDEQARMQDRMRDWARLSPIERSQARIIFQQAQKITPETRQAKWEAYQALAPEQRQELADKAAKKALAFNAPVDERSAKSGKSAALTRKPALPNQAKSNLVPDRTTAPAPKPVAPTLVQNKPGATTSLINQTAVPPVHQPGGMPKILATPDVVDPHTLLPRRAAASAADGLSAVIATPVRQ